MTKLRELWLLLRILFLALTPPLADPLEKVERYLRRRVESGEHSDLARLFLAEVYCGQKHYREAKRELLHLSLEHGPLSTRARAALGITGYYLEEYEDSIRYLESVRGKGRDSPRIEFYLGLDRMNLGAWSEAIEQLLDPKVQAVNRVHTADAIAYCYFQLGELEKSIAYYRKVIDIKPELERLRISAARVHVALANRHTDNSRYADAITELELALSLSPPEADALEMRRTIRVLEQEVRRIPLPRSLTLLTPARPRTAPPSSPPSRGTP